MLAMNYWGPLRVRIDHKPLPEILHPRDAIGPSSPIAGRAAATGVGGRIAAAGRRGSAPSRRGLVELGSPHGEVSYKHIDELTPEDRQARAEAERVLMGWIIERQRGRRPPPSRFYSRMQ